jgi:hypothetical protein
MDIVLACEARIPIVQVSTRDPINIVQVLEAVLGTSMTVYPDDVEEGVYVIFGDYDESVEDLYTLCLEASATAVIINASESLDLALDVGEVLPLESTVLDLLSAMAVDTDEEIYPSVSSLTLREIKEVVSLIQASGEAVLATTVAKALSSYQPATAGLEPLTTNMIGMYLPNEEVGTWLQYEAPYLHCRDYNYVPRGLVFHGKGGLGKSLGARYLARELEIPCYKLELAGLLDKYVGVSESTLKNALARADELQPAVLLLDEVDKLFVDNDDGVSDRLLSILLWWMQERSSRLIVVMTCNKLDRLPPHLYREGRIDQVIKFDMWTNTVKIKKYLRDLLDGAKNPHTGEPLDPKIKSKVMKVATKKLRDQYGSEWKVTPAQLNVLVYSGIKKILVGGHNE